MLPKCSCPLSITRLWKKQLKFISVAHQLHHHRYISIIKTSSSQQQQEQQVIKNGIGQQNIVINSQSYPKDDWCNVTDKILGHLGRNLHREKYNPLCHTKNRIVDFMYKNFQGRSKRTPLFSVFDNLSPVVTVDQNFDSLLVPKDHPSRKKTDSYYLNKDTLLRAHTSAHQVELIRQGMNNFLVVGDVYRRDEVDRSHYPVFHQVEAVRLCGHHELFQEEKVARELSIFDQGGSRSPGKQESHSVDAVMVMTRALQSTLIKLVQHLFGKGKYQNNSKEKVVYFHYGCTWKERFDCGRRNLSKCLID